MHLLVLLPFVLVLGAAASASEFSTDVTVRFADTLAADEDVVEDAQGSMTRIDLGALPASSDLVAYSVATDGDLLFVLDVPATLPGGLYVTPRDVVRFDGSQYSIELRGGDHGVAPGAEIDAVGVLQGDLLLSFDVAGKLGTLAVEDEDLVRLESTQPDLWSLAFDGSAQGVPVAADLDGADVLDATGDFALSFDISGTVAGIGFADEDVLRFARGSGAWSMLYDGSAHHAVLVAADVDALFVPEPGGMGAAFAIGATLLAIAQRKGAQRCDAI